MTETGSGREIFSRGGITITPEIARINGTSYPINGIGSVRIAEPNKLGPVIVAIAFFLVAYANRDNAETSPVIWVVIGLAALVYAWRKPSVLYIHTASSDRPALKGRLGELSAVKDAIETAVTMRG